MTGISIWVSETHWFPTQGKAVAYFSDVLNRYKPGERLSETDEAEVLQLFQHHPARDEKLQGRQVIGIEVHKAKGGTQCFYLRLKDPNRVDGALVDFSFRKCIDSIAKRSA